MCIYICTYTVRFLLASFEYLLSTRHVIVMGTVPLHKVRSTGLRFKCSPSFHFRNCEIPACFFLISVQRSTRNLFQYEAAQMQHKAFRKRASHKGM